MIITGMAHFESVAQKKLVEGVPQEQTGGSDRPWKRIRGMVMQNTPELQVPCIYDYQRRWHLC